MSTLLKTAVAVWGGMAVGISAGVFYCNYLDSAALKKRADEIVKKVMERKESDNG